MKLCYDLLNDPVYVKYNNKRLGYVRPSQARLDYMRNTFLWFFPRLFKRTFYPPWFFPISKVKKQMWDPRCHLSTGTSSWLILQGILKGKYHCTVDLLFDWFGISCMTTDIYCFYLLNRPIQTSQKGGQQYSDTSPFSIPWPSVNFL